MRLCINPGNLGGQLVNCNRCSHCRERRRDNWALLSLFEAESGAAMWAITLTYRPGEAGENFLKYSDVQNMFKRLRKAGYRFRYICAGELGGKKGRPHWHLLVWWSADPPDKGKLLGVDTAYNERWAFPFWPHGHAHINEGAEPTFARYISKYIQKADGQAGKFVPSRNPGIGAVWQDDHARRHARNGSIWAKNVFKINGYESALPYERWRRYRKVFLEEWQAIGRDASVLLAFEAYENILLDDERAEFEQFSDDLATADRLFVRPTDWQEHAVKLALLDNSKGGRPMVERLSTYMRGPVRFMRFEHSGPKRWLHGLFHLPGGFLIQAQSGKTRRKVDIPISAVQFGDILQGNRPVPESDPFAPSDWITEQAGQVRLQKGLRPVAASAPRLSHVPNYRDLKVSGCQS